MYTSFSSSALLLSPPGRVYLVQQTEVGFHIGNTVFPNQWISAQKLPEKRTRFF